jgi:hypothetical protein
MTEEVKKYNVGQIIKCKGVYLSDKTFIGKIVATRVDKPDNYLVTWFEPHENWFTPDKIIEVCPIETLKEAAKADQAVEELIKSK